MGLLGYKIKPEYAKGSDDPEFRKPSRFVPSLPAPGAVPTVPTVPPGKDMPTSEFGFLYSAIQSNAAEEPGTLASGTLSYNLAIPITVSPTAGSETLSWSFTQTQFLHSGARGVRFDRSATELSAQSVMLSLGGTPVWETTALDFDASITPGPDLILAYAHMTGDPGDHVRLSQKTLVNGGVKVNIGGEKIGTPSANTHVLTVWSPTGASPAIGGISSHVFNDTNGLELVQRSASSDQTWISMNGVARIAFDNPHTQDNLFRLLDINSGHSTPSAGNKNRLVVGMPNTIQGRVSLNTDVAQGLFDIRGEAAASATVVFNRYLIGARTDNGSPNRAFVLAQQTSTAGTDNVLSLSGDLDAASAIGTPTLNSTTSHGSAWWFDTVNNRSHLIASPAGTNQTITKSFSWAQNAGAPLVGFYGTNPAAKPTVSGSRGANAALASLLTGLAGLGLITDSSS